MIRLDFRTRKIRGAPGNSLWISIQLGIVAFVGPAAVEGFVPFSQFHDQTGWKVKQNLSFLEQGVSEFHRRVFSPSGSRRIRISSLWSRGDNGDEEDDEGDIDLGDKDWRTFRAKLFMDEPDSNTSSQESFASAMFEEEEDLDGFGALFSRMDITSKSVRLAEGTTDEQSNASLEIDPSQWAYESSELIEQGAVILGGVDQDVGFGLQQQYYHKAAILVIEHDEAQFTKGIILNRPSDKFISDDINEGIKWRVWFGGDVESLDSDEPDIVCIHSLKTEEAVKSSVGIMKDIQWTSFEVAKKLVCLGFAKPSDFCIFAGYVGWGPGELATEVERNSWYMVATDSHTLLKELAHQNAVTDPREAGIDTWELLMKMIGREENAKKSVGTFDDLMLKEWARNRLFSKKSKSTARSLPSNNLGKTAEDGVKYTDFKTKLVPGTLLRGSSAERSPFLLARQEYHKSLVLVLSDDEDATIGVMLNHPAAKGLEMEIVEKKTGKTTKLTMPLRYGGECAVEGEQSLLWLHCSPTLREAQIGTAIGDGEGPLWECTYEDVAVALSDGLVELDEFLVVSGITIWPKGEEDVEGGTENDLVEGNFEIVPPSCVENVWNSLLKQEVLTQKNIQTNIARGMAAWSAGGGDYPVNEDKDIFGMGCIGMGYEEEDDSLVFKSDVKASELSDDALRIWVSTFLLGITEPEEEQSS